MKDYTWIWTVVVVDMGYGCVYSSIMKFLHRSQDFSTFIPLERLRHIVLFRRINNFFNVGGAPPTERKSRSKIFKVMNETFA
jgi:hypothetical protein